MIRAILAFPLFSRERKLIPLLLFPLKTTQGQTSSRKRTNAVWEDFERVLVDGV